MKKDKSDMFAITVIVVGFKCLHFQPGWMQDVEVKSTITLTSFTVCIKQITPIR
ncbi:hypothetical protein MPTK1_5g01730 [Marchantia polymorpha subsp. ruderalis]|uniref:Uncharacterized protein n=2 Tax=Marchantia polymorpha TaxID=3197 RepID=A0AAF6BDV7_MARPO|nr:hypothetical protein MARPO_0161s0031 [Marchantia polymorpha]BBN10191.1 hypothetical protein Mp_5g01730 [Marchantia polymorpha subsp. ruderalis]|eukprot:PTQ28535.1 hypothetical protein MARPO_0161s0031 [Marchantia polymorpha]